MPLLSPAGLHKHYELMKRSLPKGIPQRKRVTLVRPHLSIVVFDDLQVKEVVFILSIQGGIPTSSLRNFKLILRAEIISWEKQQKTS